MTANDVSGVVGAEVFDREGQSIGTVTQVVSTTSDGSQLLSVDSGFLGRLPQVVFAPESSFDGSVVRLPFDRAVIDAAPGWGVADIDDTQVAELVRHYSRDRLTHRDAVTDAAEAVSTVRSEERLHVRTAVRPYSVVRLRKIVVVEEQTITVPVRRETLVVERLDAGDVVPVGGPDWDDRDALSGDLDSVRYLRETGEVLFEATLREERVVVTTEVVPVERVVFRAEVSFNEETVSAPVRRERVEVVREPRPRR